MENAELCWGNLKKKNWKWDVNGCNELLRQCWSEQASDKLYQIILALSKSNNYSRRELLRAAFIKNLLISRNKTNFMPLKAQEWGMTTPPVWLAYVINLICIHWVNCGYGTLFIMPESDIFSRHLVWITAHGQTTHSIFVFINIWCISIISLTDIVPDDAGLVKQISLKLDLSFTSSSSSAATGPNPQAGRPLQGPGVVHRDPPMAGTWAPIERGVTVTSSKCPVFKGKLRRAGGLGFLCPPDVSDTLPTCDYSSHVTASTLSPSVHSAYWFSVPSTHCCANSAPASSHSLSHSRTPTIRLVQSRECRRAAFLERECMKCVYVCVRCCSWWRKIHLLRDFCFDLRDSHVPRSMLGQGCQA